MTNSTGVGPLYNLSFAYDSKGRRIQKIISTNSVTFTTNTFLYDGWNLIAEVGTSGSLVRSYVWGTDLSGSPQGAGGVGGLLELCYHSSPTSITNAFVAYDGNGNVTALDLKQASCEADRPRGGFLISFNLGRSPFRRLFACWHVNVALTPALLTYLTHFSSFFVVRGHTSGILGPLSSALP
jgi:hypothetical protein